MKRIFLSLGMLLGVGALVVGGTIAFYNDTETSTGNIFVAGSIDLKVDHLKQTYNGVDCKTCDVVVVSDTSNMVVERNGVPLGPTNALVVTPTGITNTYWTANVPGSDWIWATDPVLVADDDFDTIYTFEKKFNWFGPTTGATLTFSLAADNSYEVWLNGVLIDSDPTESNHVTPDSINLPLTSIVQGENTLQFKVKNWAQPGGSPVNNPGGLRYALHIDGNCDDAYFQNQCRLWDEKDLEEGDTFFNFDDVKPADWGTNVISLHVYDNDAYACLITTDKDDQENTLLETETEDGDAPNQGNVSGFGELSNYINVFTWDDDGDGIFESGEDALGGGTLGDLDSIMSLDTDDDYLTATTTKNIGLAWCAGNLTVNEGLGFDCDGAGMQNSAQSDSFSANLVAYAEQTRNNGDFSCSAVDLEPEEETLENQPL